MSPPVVGDGYRLVRRSWTREHDTAVTYWTAVHFFSGFLISWALLAWCGNLTDIDRAAVVLALAVAWEVVEWAFPQCALLLEKIILCGKTPPAYTGDHITNALCDIAAAMLAFAVVYGLPLPGKC